MTKFLRIDNRKATSHCFKVLDDQPDKDALHLAVWRKSGDEVLATRVILAGEKVWPFVSLSFGSSVPLETYKADPKAFSLGLLDGVAESDLFGFLSAALRIAYGQRRGMSVRWFRTNQGHTRASDLALQKKYNKELPWGDEAVAISRLKSYEASNPVKRPNKGSKGLIEDAKALMALPPVAPQPVALDPVSSDLDAMKELETAIPTCCQDDEIEFDLTLDDLTDPSGGPAPAVRSIVSKPVETKKPSRGPDDMVDKSWSDEEWVSAIKAAWPSEWASPQKVAVAAGYDSWVGKVPMGVAMSGMTPREFIHNSLQRDSKGKVFDEGLLDSASDGLEGGRS